MEGYPALRSFWSCVGQGSGEGEELVFLLKYDSYLKIKAQEGHSGKG
jgi:hypothetical protein